MSDTPRVFYSSTDCVLGIDVGGTKITAGIVGYSGQIHERRTIPTRPERLGQAVLTDVVALTGELLARAFKLDLCIHGIGVGVAELVSPQGDVQSASSIAWQGIPVRQTLGKLGPCVVEADSRAAALGEARFGAGWKLRDFFYVTVGTGIGSAYIQGDSALPGAKGCAGTIASAPMTAYCAACGKESSAVLEQFASGPALVARYNRLKPGAATRAEEVTAAAAAGDRDAIEVVRTAAQALGSTVGLMVNVLDPEAVIVGGGLGSAGGLYWEALVESIRKHIWSDINRGLPILPAAHGPDAGFLGAAAVAMDRLP